MFLNKPWANSISLVVTLTLVPDMALFWHFTGACASLAQALGSSPSGTGHFHTGKGCCGRPGGDGGLCRVVLCSMCVRVRVIPYVHLLLTRTSLCVSPPLPASRPLLPPYLPLPHTTLVNCRIIKCRVNVASLAFPWCVARGLAEAEAAQGGWYTITTSAHCTRAHLYKVSDTVYSY